MAHLHEEIRTRYLNYAMSVIMSRAIPDVRDGLKPVQRRILYAMYKNLRLTPSARFRKSAAIVGEVMGKYHPHGDSAIYGAMVRMAQDFSLRYPLVDGHGNFGSIDGDNAAAMRYTEAKLLPLAERLLDELGDGTVGYRPNYDGTVEEPDVLPAQIPNLLVNGATGIAVGMATNIPPHNLKECIDACCDLISNPSRKVSTLVKNHIKGPDFPTGGVILESQDEIAESYETGSGTFTIRARWHLEKVSANGKQAIVVTEIPYSTNKDTLVQKIAEHVANNKVPQITDVRDESTDEIRVVMDLKRGSDENAALAYLFKHTPLEDRFHLNMTCLLPSDDLSVPKPDQVDLKTVLQAFLDFRLDVTTKRLQNKLDGLESRIHILEAFEVVFGDIQKVLKIVQKATSKKEARKGVMKGFGFDEEQAEAIISIPLYRLANTEKEGVLNELKAKRGEAERLREVLSDEEARWSLVRTELREIGRAYGDDRRTSVEVEVEDYEYNEEDFIEAEDLYVVVSRDGWVRTQKSYGDLSSLRCRDNDEIGWVLPGNTKDTVLFFTSAAKCYTARIVDLTLTTGYGDPIQSMFSFGDGEKIVNVLTLSDLVVPGSPDPADIEMVSVAKSGLAVRYNLDGFDEPSTVVGRTFQRLEDGDSVVNCCYRQDGDHVVLATHNGRGTTFEATEVKSYKGPGKGVKSINIQDGDLVLAFTLCGDNQSENLYVETNRGAERMVTHQTYKPTKRGNKGYTIIKRGHLIRWKRQPVEINYPGDE